MLLNDYDILQYQRATHFIVPFDSTRVGAASVDLLLGSDILTQPFYMDAVPVDPRKDQADRFVPQKMAPDGYWVQPGEFLLGCTVENIRLTTDVAARIEGKSSLGRLGLLVHVTAGFIDPGFSGHITLEICNLMKVPFLILPNMPIAQICFMELRGECRIPYNHQASAKYMNQTGPTASKYHLNFTKDEDA